MRDFIYRRPASLAEAAAMFGESEEPRYLAGGQSLIPLLKHRLAQPETVIDLAHVPGLRGIAIADGVAAIGALTTHAEVAACAALGGLASLAGSIGDAQVRHMGTLGGSLAHADPAADYPAAMLALDAAIHTDRRIIAADDFFLDLFETALEPGEIVTRVTLRLPDASAYAKVGSPASRYAVAGVMVARFGPMVRVAVTGAGPCAFRWNAAESTLGSRFAADAVDALPLDASRFNSDLHATAEYRAHLVRVLTRRLVQGLGGAI